MTLKKWPCAARVLLLMTAFLLWGCAKDTPTEEDFKTEYQAVLLANGSVHFGKIEKIDKTHVEMADVFYIQNIQNPDTKQVESKLVRKGKEMHGPDRMYLNYAHILVIEPVSPDSKIAQAIKEIKQQTGP